MSVWGILTRGLWATDEATRPERPTFEHLEPRILLSADPTGLAAQNSLDLLEGPVDAEAAIVIDFELVAGDEALQFPDHGSQITDIEEGISEVESQEGESSQDEFTTAGLVVSSPSESQPAPSDVEGITDDRLQTADDPSLITDYRSLITNPVIDSHTEGSIEARGPPTEIVFIDSSLNLDFQLENAGITDVSGVVWPDTADGLSLDEVQSLAESAIDRWVISGIAPEQLQALEGLTYAIDDLSANRLGLYNDGHITLDDDGASSGWFVDHTPGSDEEFLYSAQTSLLEAKTGAIADGGADLLTVLMHEQGHALGLSELYSAGTASDLMYGSSSKGTRLLPSAGLANGAAPGTLEGTHYLSQLLATNGEIEDFADEVSIQAPAGTDRLLVVFLGDTTDNSHADGVTSGAGDLIEAVEGFNSNSADIWYLPLGTSDIPTPLTNANRIRVVAGSFAEEPDDLFFSYVGAAVFDGIDQTNPLGDTAGGTIASLTLDTNPGDLVVNFEYISSSSCPEKAAAGQTSFLRGGDGFGFDDCWESSFRIATATSTTMTFDGGSNSFRNHIAAVFNLSNAVPTITVGNASYTEDENSGNPVQIDASATANDADGDAEWDGGSLTVQITANSEPTDELSIAAVGGISVSGANVQTGGSTTFGTIVETSGTANDGVVTNGDLLTINFNANATNSLVQALVQAISYRTTSNTPSTTARTATFTVTDGHSASASDTSTLSVTDAAEVVNLSVNVAAGTEAAQTVVTVTATAGGAVTGAQTVAIAASGTGITAGDGTLSNATIAILNGATSGNVTYTIQDDSLVEGAETATLTISSPTAGLTLGATTTQDVAIADNDSATLLIGDASVTEGDSGTTTLSFPVTLDNPVDVNVDVDYETGDDTATTADNDYVGVTTPATFTMNAGDTAGTIEITVNGDTTVEMDETLTLLLTNLQASGRDVTLAGTGTLGGSWSKLGGDIDGEAAGDESGYSVAMSDDGNTVVIGAYRNDGIGSNAGHARVYRFDGATWNQLGGDIDGEAADDFSGWSAQSRPTLPATPASTALTASPGTSSAATSSGKARTMGSATPWR